MRFINAKRGSSALPYALIVAGIAFTAIVSLQFFGPGVSSVVGKAGSGIAGGAPCAAGSIEGYGHGLITHGQTETATKPGSGAPPANATGFEMQATIGCNNGKIELRAESPVATACVAEYRIEAGSCVQAPLSPTNLALPTVSGSLVIGETLTADPGSWKSNPAPSFLYQWLRDDAEIDGATDGSYVLAEEDGNATISVRVIASNDHGSMTAVSAATAAIGAGPANSAPPVLLGIAEIGTTLTVQPGTWSGTPQPALTYQWLRDGAEIDGATQASHQVDGADGNHALSVRETATNDHGSATADSAATDTVGAAPVNDAAPEISGAVAAGEALTLSDGGWTGTPAPSFTYQWLRDGVAIGGATQPGYTVTIEDGNHALSGAVTATNIHGSATATSAASDPVPAAPISTALPAITGTPAVGQTLTGSNGGWTGTPAPGFAYQWLRGGNPIADATTNSYTLVPADGGQTIAFAVTASNSVGSATATGNASGQTQYGPVNTALPTIGGTPATGQTLTAAAGGWNGFPAPTYAYQWHRGGSSIDGATGATYTPVAADSGQTLTVTVTASNPQGSATATSGGFGPIGQMPANASPPVISGTPAIGQTLTASDGSWNAHPAPGYAYQWKRGGADIDGATAASYTLVAADGGQAITVTVTASNTLGSASATSAATAPVQQGPANTTAPSISGSVVVGGTLNASTGSWSGYPTPSYAYQWKRGGADIGGATAASYTIVAADQNYALTVTVTASNAAGSANATSTATMVVPIACSSVTVTATNTLAATNFNIPDGCNSATIIVLGGGGGGGGANESGSGSAAGGGGSGGCYYNSTVSITPGTGRTGSATVGAAGAGGTNGGNGGNSTLTMPGVSLTATGGAGTPFRGNGAYATTGGAGGTPGGNTGGGRQGTSGESAIGGNGASSCGGLGTGGAGGNVGGYSGPNAYGKAATGYGAGGGGAGNRDRTSPNSWTGGAGSQGLVQVTFGN